MVIFLRKKGLLWQLPTKKSGTRDNGRQVLEYRKNSFLGWENCFVRATNRSLEHPFRVSFEHSIGGFKKYRFLSYRLNFEIFPSQYCRRCQCRHLEFFT